MTQAPAPAPTSTPWIWAKRMRLIARLCFYLLEPKARRLPTRRLGGVTLVAGLGLAIGFFSSGTVSQLAWLVPSSLALLAVLLLTWLRLAVVVPVAAIALSSAALSIVFGLFAGYHAQMLAIFAPLQGHAMISAYGGGDVAYLQHVQDLESDPKIACAVPSVIGQAVASHADPAQSEFKAVMLKGIGLAQARKCPLLGSHLAVALKAIHPVHRDQVPGVALGAGLARRLGVGIGDRVALATLMPIGREPSRRTFDVKEVLVDVAAIVHLPLAEWDDALVLLDLHSAQAMTTRSDRVQSFELEIVADALDEALAIAKQWTATFNQGKHLAEFRASSWLYADDSGQVIASGRRALMAVALVLFASCASALASSLVLALRRRAALLGVWLALGATPTDLRWAGTGFGLVTGLGGALLGIAWARFLVAIVPVDALRDLGIDFSSETPWLGFSWADATMIGGLGTSIAALSGWALTHVHLKARRNVIDWLVES